MTPEEFRRLGHQVVDWVADYRERAATPAGHVAGDAGRDQGAVAGVATARCPRRSRPSSATSTA